MDLKEILMDEKKYREDALLMEQPAFEEAMSKVNVIEGKADVSSLTQHGRNMIDNYNVEKFLNSLYTDYLRTRSGLEYDTEVFGLGHHLQNVDPRDMVDFKTKERLFQAFGQTYPIDDRYDTLEPAEKKEYLFSLYDRALGEKGYTDMDIKEACSSVAQELWNSEIVNSTGKTI